MSRDAGIRVFFICALALALNFSISATQIIAALLLLDWGWRSYRSRAENAWRPTEIDAPIFFFATWSVVITMFHRSTGLRDALSTQSSFLLFFWAVQALDGHETRRFFRWMCVGAAAAGALGVLQELSKINYLPVQRAYVVPETFSNWPHWLTKILALNNERAMGPRNHPLTYAESFIPGFFLLLGRLLREARNEKRLTLKMSLLTLGLLAVIGGVLLAQGRAVWLGLGVGLIVFAAMVGRRFFLRTMTLFALGLIIVAVVSPRIRGRFLSVATSSGGTAGDQQSKSIRFTLWREALAGIAAHPFAGVGMEGTHLTCMDPVLLEERVWTETHNMFLQFTLELGFIGMGLLLWVFVLLVRRIWRAPADWGPAFSGMFVAFMIAGLTESWPKDKEIAMLFWLLMGNLVFLTHEKA